MTSRLLYKMITLAIVLLAIGVIIIYKTITK